MPCASAAKLASMVCHLWDEWMTKLSEKGEEKKEGKIPPDQH